MSAQTMSSASNQKSRPYTSLEVGLRRGEDFYYRDLTEASSDILFIYCRTIKISLVAFKSSLSVFCFDDEYHQKNLTARWFFFLFCITPHYQLSWSVMMQLFGPLAQTDSYAAQVDLLTFNDESRHFPKKNAIYFTLLSKTFVVNSQILISS